MDVPTVEKVGVVGKLVKGSEMVGPQARTLMKKVERSDRKVWNLTRFGQEDVRDHVNNVCLRYI